MLHAQRTSRRAFSLLFLLSCAGFFALMLSPRSVAHNPLAPSNVDANTLLFLRFENSLNGEQGETPNSASGHSFQQGIQGQGVLLPNGNQVFYPSANNINSLEGTIEFWLKPNWNGNDAQSHEVLIWGTFGGLRVAKDGANNLRIILNRFNTERGVAFNVSSWQANEWHHVAFTYSNTQKLLKLFTDGVLRAQQTFTGTLPTVTTSAFQLGADGTTGYLNAVLDEFVISNVARSDQDIADRYATALDISLTLNPSTVNGGQPATGTVRLNANAPASGLTVNLNSSNAAVATVPSSVSIPANSSSAAFTINTNTVPLLAGVNITASGNNEMRTARLYVSPTTSVYCNDFEGAVGSEWSAQTISTTPAGRNFLEPPRTGTTRLTLNNLPAHTTVTVSLDLLMIASWDGNVATFGGPDIWRLNVNNVQTLTDASFSNQSSNPQSYPDNYPANFAAYTGAAEINTLGFGGYGDSVYRMLYTFPHTGSNLVLNFSGVNLTDEYWGLDNVCVNVDGGFALSLNPSTITSGQTTTGTIVLKSPAPANGATVMLSSNNTSVATVPPSITVPEGTTSNSFIIHTTANNNTSLVDISATYGTDTRMARLRANPAIPDLVVQQLQANPPSPVEAGTAIQLSAQVKNTGTLAATCNVRFYLDAINAANLIGEQTGVALETGEQTNVSVNWNTTGLLGSHNIIANAENAAPAEENTSNNSATLQGFQLVDTTPPDTVITVGPNAGASLQPGPVTFTWTGQDNSTPLAQLRYQDRLDGGAWTPAAPDGTTTLTFNNLNEGNHTFDVRAVDASDNTDGTPATRPFMIDATSPAVGNISVTEITYRSARINWTTNEPTTGKVEYAIRNGAFIFSKSDATLTTNHSLILDALGSNAPVRVRVVANDAAGNQTTSPEASFKTALLRDMSVKGDDITYSNAIPGDGDVITMSVRVRNYGDVNGTATVVFYDALANGATREISRANVSVPAYSEGVNATSLQFEVSEGMHNPSVQLINIGPGDDVTTNHTASKELLVGAPAERFTLSVSNPDTWPGNQGTFLALVKNTGTLPRSLTGAQLTGLSWANLISTLPAAPLNPGDEAQLAFSLDTPANEPGGPIDNPVLKPVTLSVTGAPSAPFNFAVEVYTTPPTQLDVIVKDALTGEPVQGASIALERISETWTTGANGKPVDVNGQNILLATHAGAQSIHAYAPGYASNSIGIGPTPSSSTKSNPRTQSAATEILLERSLGLEVTDVEVRELTPDEAAERGVDISDPVNYWVYDFVVRMEIGEITIYNVVHQRSGDWQASGSGYVAPCTTCGTAGGPVVSNYFYSVTHTDGRDNWIIIPGEIRIIKQFWEATVFVKNTSQVTTLHHARASLTVEPGLTLPPLNGNPQPAIIELGDLAPQQVSRSAKWVLRGDVPGLYRLRGNASADGVATVNLQSREFEVAFPRISVSFQTPDAVTAGQTFTLGITIRNDSPIDLQMVSVRIKADRLHNCSLADAPIKTIGTIPRGGVASVSFNFISDLTGKVIKVDNYVSPTPVDPGVSVEPLAGCDPPQLESVRFEQDVSVIDANPAYAGGGQRIFPDKPRPDSQGNFKSVKIRALTSCPGVKVYFKSYDIDDPTTDDAPVDSNGSQGNDNRAPDNPEGVLSATSATADATGAAVITLDVTMYPGDNFRVGAALNEADLPPTLDAAHSQKEDHQLASGQVKLTKKLFVWRRVHVEVDSMGTVTNNHVEGIVQSVQSDYLSKLRRTNVEVLPSNGSLETGRFQNGRLVINGTSYDVVNNEGNRLTLRTGRRIHVTAGTPFVLYDDDNLNGSKNGDEGTDVPAPDLSLMQESDDPNANVYASAYIKPTYGTLSAFNESALPFVLNEAPCDGSFRDLSRALESDDFWVVYIQGAYQPPRGGDADPDGNPYLEGNRGLTIGAPSDDIENFAGLGEDVSFIYAEVIRDKRKYGGWLADGTITAPHEVGHQFGLRGDNNLSQPSELNRTDYGIMTYFSSHSHEFGPIHLSKLRSRVKSPGPNSSAQCAQTSSTPAADIGSSMNIRLPDPPSLNKLSARPLTINQGVLDTTFDTDGKVTTDVNGGDDFAYAVAVQADGKIVVAGDALNGSDSDFSLVRYKADGSLDTGFGTGGKTLTPIGGADYANDVILQPDGKIIVAGLTVNGTQNDFALVRYEADGALDTSFGAGGKVITDFAGYDDEAASLALQSDGKIVVAGVAGNGGTDDVALARYNTNGTLDQTFGNGGRVTTPVGFGNERASDVVIQTDNKIVIAGEAVIGQGTDFLLARYNTNGTLDQTFGAGGTVVTDFNNTTDAATSLALQSDGKIVAAGYAGSLPDADFALARYDASGVLDATFGAGGKVTTVISNELDVANDIAVYSNGVIAVAGDSHNGTDTDFTVVEYLPSGALNSLWGAGGIVTTPVGASDDYITAMKLQPDSKLVVAGGSFNGSDDDFAAARYIPFVPTAATANISGRVTSANGQSLGGVVIELSGARQSRTITDGDGNYRFANVEVDAFYTLTPSLANYDFNPRNRSFSLLADKTDAVFTATPYHIPTASPLDTPEFFVRQQYLDFLDREPEPGGLNYWTRQLTQCGADEACRRQRRIGVSNAFFFEAEFQKTGAFVYRLYKAAYGETASYRPAYAQFINDRTRIDARAGLLDQSLQSLANAFAARPEFIAKYPSNLNGPQFVDAMLATIKSGSDVNLRTQREALINEYEAGGRGRVLYRLASDDAQNTIDNRAFVDAEYNRSFVLTEYFGYLRRDPDVGGYDFWLGIVNRFPLRDLRGQQAMVCAFLTSREYQERFSSISSHSNSECPPAP